MSKEENIKDYYDKIVAELKLQDPYEKRSEFTKSCAELDKHLEFRKSYYGDPFYGYGDPYYSLGNYDSAKPYYDSYHNTSMDDLQYIQDKMRRMLNVPEKFLGNKLAPPTPAKEVDMTFHIIKNRNVPAKEEIKMMDTVKAAADVVESTLSKEITSGISEEVIAYGLVHALTKQGEAIVGTGELPLIKMTPSMLTKIREHLETELKDLKKSSDANSKGQTHRLKNFYEALIALTER